MTEPIEYRIEPRANIADGRAYLIVKCSRCHAGECRFGLWQRAAGNVTWHWDGKIEGATITPSVSCTPCGRHFSIINGEVVP